MEGLYFPCIDNELPLDQQAVGVGGRIACNMGFMDGQEVSVLELQGAANVADKVGQEQAATYLREGRVAVLACARNWAQARCPDFCRTVVAQRQEVQSSTLDS